MSSNHGNPVILNSSHISDLREALSEVRVRWSDIGNSLRVPQVSLQEIRHNLHLRNDGQRLEEVLTQWIGSGKANIHDLLKALKSRIIHRVDIANQICAREWDQRTSVGLCTARCGVCYPNGPEVPLEAPRTDSKLDFKTLLNNERLTERELKRKIDTEHLLDLAGLFDNAALYVDKLYLRPGEKVDVRTKVMTSGNLFAMHHALECWKGRNPLHATFKNLLQIVLDLGKGEIAIEICYYYKRKCKQSPAPPLPDPTPVNEDTLESTAWSPTDSVSLQPPVITEQPESIAVVNQAQNVVIEIKAKGRELRYQWRRQTSLEKIPTVVHNCGGYEDVDTPTLRIRTAFASLAGYYSCRVMNPGGTVLSQAAHLSIGVCIDGSPGDQQVEEGSTVRMSVRATGTDLVYQWYKDSKQLFSDRVYKGTTTSTLSIVGANFATVGSYVCRVSNHINEKETEPAHLEIISQLPRITRHPQDVTVRHGHEDITLSVTAQGGLLHYQWRKHYSQADEGEALVEGEGHEGVHTRQLVVRSVSAEEEVLYSCRVSNMRGTVSSQKARVSTRQESRSWLLLLTVLVGLVAVLGGGGCYWWYNSHTADTSSYNGGPSKSYSHKSVPTINPDNRPDYTKIRNYPLPDGTFIDIAQKIAGMGYNKFATLLLEDSDGTKVNVIKAGKRDTVEIVADILKKWLQRSGKATWNVLVNSLRQSELNVLADQISSSFV